MKTVHKFHRGGLRCCSTILLLVGFTILAHGDDPSWTVVEWMPRFLGMNMDAGVYTVTGGHSLVGRDVWSDAERWKNQAQIHRASSLFGAYPRCGTKTI